MLTRTLRPICILIVLLATGACGGSTVLPAPSSTVTPTPTPTPAPAAGGLTTGRVTDALQPGLGLASAVLGGSGFDQATTDAGGNFQLRSTAGGTYPLTINGTSSYVERRTRVTVPGGNAAFSVIPMTFDLATFDQSYRSDGTLIRWTSTPNIVVQRNLVDYGSSVGGYLVLAETISDADLNCLAAYARDAVNVMSGGAVSVGSVTIGGAQAGSRVQSLDSATGGITFGGARNLGSSGLGGGTYTNSFVILRGFAFFSADQGGGQFLRCGQPAGLYLHETGHALGYQHVTNQASIMTPILVSNTLSDFDRQAIAIVYQRSPGNTSPDVDPTTFSVNVFGGTHHWQIR